MPAWYLVRTRSNKERSVRDQLGMSLPEVFLPLLRVKVRRWERLSETLVPLFPCYLFARFELETDYLRVRWASGVRDLVRAGSQPRTVPEEIVAELRRRCAGGAVELAPAVLNRGERVRVVAGPLRGLEAVFERYLSGTERVALFLASLERFTPRVVMRAEAVEPLERRRPLWGAAV
ncbi:MAG TPA: transcription termination/antitermination NusG family protein [Candidatus Binataceae bacterium]|jgi:transcriptional antiterminator RfaH|nr:transcription termination/antitermination NusG family protein [Candidatus Binataceae bacterium]